MKEDENLGHEPIDVEFIMSEDENSGRLKRGFSMERMQLDTAEARQAFGGPIFEVERSPDRPTSHSLRGQQGGEHSPTPPHIPHTTRPQFICSPMQANLDSSGACQSFNFFHWGHASADDFRISEATSFVQLQSASVCHMSIESQWSGEAHMPSGSGTVKLASQRRYSKVADLEEECPEEEIKSQPRSRVTPRPPLLPAVQDGHSPLQPVGQMSNATFLTRNNNRSLSPGEVWRRRSPRCTGERFLNSSRSAIAPSRGFTPPNSCATVVPPERWLYHSPYVTKQQENTKGQHVARMKQHHTRLLRSSQRCGTRKSDAGAPSPSRQWRGTSEMQWSPRSTASEVGHACPPDAGLVSLILSEDFTLAPGDGFPEVNNSVMCSIASYNSEVYRSTGKRN